MEFKGVFKKLYLKLTIFSLVFLFIFGVYFFSLRFYSQRISKKIEEINKLREQINKKESEKGKELALKQQKALIEQKTGKELPAILFNLQKKINPDFDSTKNLILDRINKDNLKIINSSFSSEEGKINFVLEGDKSNIESFLDFIINEALVLKTEKLKIEPKEKKFNLEILLKLK